MTKVPLPHRLACLGSMAHTFGKPLLSASFSCQVFLGLDMAAFYHSGAAVAN
jgi:hypothetical protein